MESEQAKHLLTKWNVDSKILIISLHLFPSKLLSTLSSKIFNPMAIHVQRISLTHEKLHFLHYSVREVIYKLIDFDQVEFIYICSAGRTARKIKKYFDLLPFNKNLNDSNS